MYYLPVVHQVLGLLAPLSFQVDLGDQWHPFLQENLLILAFLDCLANQLAQEVLHRHLFRAVLLFQVLQAYLGILLDRMAQEALYHQRVPVDLAFLQDHPCHLCLDLLWVLAHQKSLAFLLDQALREHPCHLVAPKVQGLLVNPEVLSLHSFHLPLVHLENLVCPSVLLVPSCPVILSIPEVRENLVFQLHHVSLLVQQGLTYHGHQSGLLVQGGHLLQAFLCHLEAPAPPWVLVVRQDLLCLFFLFSLQNQLALANL